MNEQETRRRRAHLLPGARLRQWLSKRFVFLAEAVGYGLSALIGIGVVYTLFARVDVTVPVDGTVRAAAESVRAEHAAFVAEYLVESGAVVSEDTALCRVFLDPADIAREQARRAASQAIALLENDPASGDARRLMEEGLSLLPRPGNAVEMAAPCAGTVSFATPSAVGEVAPAGQELARVYRADTVVFEGTLPDAGGELTVSAGQTAWIRLADTEQQMPAKVEAVVHQDGGAAVRISVTPVPALVSVRFQSLAAAGSDWIAARAVVITSRISLFRSIFGRR